jgi:hypothetical protein
MSHGQQYRVDRVWGGEVVIWEQAGYLSSPLARFLDDRLPHRQAVVESWTRALESAQDNPPALRGGHESVGWALEFRLGLDLAHHPARRRELSYLPIERCVELLTAAGFEHTAIGTLPASGTSDPVLLHWSRTHHPVDIDDAQRAALARCLELASFSQPMHRLGNSQTVDARRSLFASTVSEDRHGSDTELLDALACCWAAYLARGRKTLAMLGDRVLVAPELGNGFGVADLVIGRTLVEVKLGTKPTAEAVQKWLRQLLGYVLLDRHNALRLDAVAVYCGWNAGLLTCPLSELLAGAHPGPTLDLTTLRADFHAAFRDHLDEYAAWKESKRYPITGSTGPLA